MDQNAEDHDGKELSEKRQASKKTVADQTPIDYKKSIGIVAKIIQGKLSTFVETQPNQIPSFHLTPELLRKAKYNSIEEVNFEFII